MLLDLVGKVLIAMPDMADPRFEGAVILVCAHADTGSMGIIINKPNLDFQLRGLLSHLSMEPAPSLSERPILYGGPVELNRGFVLHTSDFQSSDTLEIRRGYFSLTGTQDILAEISQGTGPRQAIVALGYAGWSEGQLENEIVQNVWLCGVCDEALVFGDNFDEKWSNALRHNGIDPRFLMSSGGTA